MRQLSFCLGAALIFAGDWNAVGQDQDEKLVSVTAREIKLDVPESWKPVKSTSTMRVAEFAIPATDANGEGAEMVVYYFGDKTGGTKANVQRWIDQFYEDGRKHELLGGQCRDGSYVLVNISGTYKRPEGPPAAQKTIDKPGSRVVGLVLVDSSHPGQSTAALAAIPAGEPPVPAVERFKKHLEGFGPLWTESCQAIAQITDLGAVPLIVLAAGKPDMPAELSEGTKRALTQSWHALQQKHATLSTRGELRIVRGSGHNLVASAPEAIVAAVRDLVTPVNL